MPVTTVSKSSDLVNQMLNSSGGEVVKSFSAYELAPVFKEAINTVRHGFSMESQMAEASAKMQKTALSSMLKLQPKRDSVEEDKLSLESLTVKVKVRQLAAEYFGLANPSQVTDDQLKVVLALQ